MSFLLDTCTISYLRRDLPAKAKEWFSTKSNEIFFISVVSLAEIEDGIARIKTSRKKADLQDWFYGSFQEQFHERCLDIDEPVARAWGQLNAKLRKRGLTVGVQDLYIAATALVHGLAVVTCNTKDFDLTGVAVINPWS